METLSVEPPAPASVEEILRQGIHSFRNEDYPQALVCFDTVARLRPHRNDVHNHRARTYERLGRLGDALECLDRALAIDPRNVADLRNRGIVLRRLGRPGEALDCFDAVLAIDPDDGIALTKRALALNELERREEALATIDRARRSSPDDLTVLNTRVIILGNLGRYEEALQELGRMLAISPTHGDAVNNTGMVLARQGRFPEALHWYDRSLQLAPDQPQARYNRSLIRLALGDWIRGFEEFETRWETDSLKGARLAGLAPLWTGLESLNGRTILLYHEQGYGDTLMSVRYVPLLAERGARVVLAVPVALQKLLQTLPGVAEVISAGPVKAAHHCHCPLMSLPRAFRTTPDSIPARVPYLRADPAQVADWARRLGPRTKPRVGVVWGGRHDAPINYPRDVPLERLRPLFELDAEFIGLQKEMAASDRTLLERLPRLRSCGEELEDFAATAALIENLDLVIAADTAVAHLAGALGKPLWLLNRHAACWRWLREGSGSAWYPTLREFRQPTVADWDSVVQAVVKAVATELLQPRGFEAPPAAITSIPIAGTLPCLPTTASPEPVTTAPPRSVSRAKEKIRLICATRLSKEEFFSRAPLGRSLPAYRDFPPDQKIELRLFPENRAGLAGLYNTAIEEALADPAILVFIHDDIYLSDYYWSDHLHKALQSFDIVGLVGNKRRVPRQASWMFLDERFTCDNYINFSGVLGHGDPFPNIKQLNMYGQPEVEVKLLDGVLLAVRSATLAERELRFDPRFHFHFYDMDFCRQAELRQLRLGTCAMSLVHASAGALGSASWTSAYSDYLAKYGESQARLASDDPAKSKDVCALAQ
jgi:tetratricopeptide (TPR) repeat protein